MTENQFSDFVGAHRWTFAKTMPQNPHEWLARKAVPDADFVAAVLFIRANGYTKMFGRKGYVCFNLGPHRYWTMGNPMSDTTIINRAVN
jgi:hypothetical protein